MNLSETEEVIESGRQQKKKKMKEIQKRNRGCRSANQIRETIGQNQRMLGEKMTGG